jgi:recombination protein RecA
MEESKALDMAIALLDKQFGVGTVMKLGNAKTQTWPAISTGAPTLDKILGIGGLPRGRIVEIYGPESSGKSTISLSLVAQAQKMGLRCAYIDAEHALDPAYMMDLGINLDDLLLAQPNYGEEALEIVDKLVKTGDVGLIIVDSVAALVPKAELEGEMDANQMGLQARMMAKALRKITALANDNKTLIVFINQIRMKIGVMFGNPETTPGGRALPYAASVRIDLRKKEDIKNKEGDSIGIKVKAKVIKNKMAPPLKIAEFDIFYGKGVDQYGSILDLALSIGIFAQKGAWIFLDGENFAQGRENAISKLKDDQKLFEQLKLRVENESKPSQD